MSASSTVRRLRQRARDGTPLIVPGIVNALTARIFEEAGFEAVIAGGYAAAAATFALPDVGLLTETEMTEHVRRIAGAVTLPVIADADTGYGEVANVVRTVRHFEAAGAAGIIIEDQVSPKRCGHMQGKELINTAAMVAKIRAAVDARVEPETIIVARTDALGVTGLDDAIARLHAYTEAGADWLFPDAPSSIEDMKRIAAATRLPLVADMVEGSSTPLLEPSQLLELGWPIVLFPSTALRAAAQVVELVARSLRHRGTSIDVLDMLMQVDHLHELLRLQTWDSYERGG